MSNAAGKSGSTGSNGPTMSTGHLQERDDVILDSEQGCPCAMALSVTVAIFIFMILDMKQYTNSYLMCVDYEKMSHRTAL